MIPIPAVNQDSVIHGVLIKMTVNTTTYTIANTYGPITWNGDTYLGLGNFLGMNEIQDDLRATNNTLQLSLSGIPKEKDEAGLGTYTSYVSLVLESKIKGSLVKIYRAFFDKTTGALDTSSVSLRYSGYVSNFTIIDGTDPQARSDTYTVVLQLSSIHAVLERKVSGQRTNSADRRSIYPNDAGMDRVIAISNTAFDFGRPYAGGGTGGGYTGPGGGGGGGGGFTSDGGDFSSG